MIPKSLATETTLATIVGWKFELHLPLYRIEGMLDRIGVDITRGTMARWMVTCGERVQPLINLLEEKQFETGYIHMDETVVQVLKEAGKTPQSKSYMWVRATAGRYPIVGQPLQFGCDGAPGRPQRARLPEVRVRGFGPRSNPG